ncbi:aminomethyltransferase family protein [Paratissierella segnis]|jgi:aminomethyltransferase|uniref:Aminomethyl transferase family protein n=1 Tax=Paratissierella segnis TaxID=2763679 RepID=A0A926IKG0_9FIRM|nr:aminomethyltransferase family protein [Paratissierella segnis]MBC8589034.1 aminomethyl transferase family protein [Paratissierella segnis]
MTNKNIYKYDNMKRTEHMAVRKTAGWYLWTHHLMEVTGRDSAIFLDKIYANPIANLKVGRDRYTTMLNDNAEIIDDVVVFRLGEEKFWISTLFMNKLKPWLDQHKGEYEVQYTNITKKYHMYAVQGPKAKELINSMVEENIDDQKFFSIKDNKIDGIPVKINYGGFTGEKFGYEIYFPSEEIGKIEAELKKHGEPLGAKEVTEFQIMAWTLPTEAGFYYLRDLLHTNPIEVGLDSGIDWDKDFIGKEALLKVKENGPAREMLGFTMDQDDVHLNAKDLGGPGDPIIVDGEEIGRLSKFNYSYVLDKNVGYILAKKDALKIGDKIKIKDYEAVISERKFI